MEGAKRHSGTSADLVGLRPGAHVCWVVDSASRFEAMATASLDEGAALGQKLFRFGPAAAPPADPRATFADPHAAFLSRGPVDPGTMYSMFRRETETARAEGYRGLRLVADMDWLLAAGPSRAEVAAFELALDAVVNELDATVVCAYRTGHFDTDTIAEVVAVHPLTVGNPPVEPGFRMWNTAPGVWQVQGEVDALNAGPFERALGTAAAGVPELRLEAAGLGFVAVAGVQALMRVALSNPESRITVHDACFSLRQCWKLFELDRQLPGVVLRDDGTPTCS